MGMDITHCMVWKTVVVPGHQIPPELSPPTRHLPVAY